MTRGSRFNLSGFGWMFALVLVAMLAAMGTAPQAQAFVPYMVNTVVSPGELGWESPMAAVFANDGKVYISTNTYIKVIDRYAGAISNLAGTGAGGYSGDGGDASLAMLNSPMGLYLDWRTNLLYVADANNNAIREIDLNQNPPQINTIAGTGVSGSSGDGGLAVNAKLNQPYSITMDAAGNLYIADMFNHKVRIINPSGYINTYAGTGVAGFGGDTGPASAAALNAPVGVSVDRENGHLYIADIDNFVIREVDLYDGIINTIAGIPGVQGSIPAEGPAQSVSFGAPVSLYAFEDAVFVTDNLTSSVGIIEMKEGSAPYYFPIIGNGTAGFYGDGMNSSSALLSFPNGAVWGPPGNLFIADSGNQRIREINVKDSEPELIVMQKGGGSGIVNANPGVGINCTSDRFESGVVSLNRNLALSVSNEGQSQEMGVMVRRADSYLSNAIDGQWNIRQLNIANTGSPENYGFRYGVSNIAGGIYNAGMYKPDGTYQPGSGTAVINSSGKVTISGFSPDTIFDQVLSADNNFMTAIMINSTTRFIRVSNRRGAGFVTADLAGRWAFRQLKVKMTGAANDDTHIETGELNMEPDGDYWGSSKGRTWYANFTGVANIDSDGNVYFETEPGEEMHMAMAADRQTIIGVTKNTGSETLGIWIFTRMAEDYQYITADMSGDWYFRGLMTQQAGYPQMADSSRCDITGGPGGMTGLVNGICYETSGSTSDFSFETKLEMDGTWILDKMQYNWGCEAKPEYGTYVTLNATPDGSSTFTGWETQDNICSGTGPCSFNIYNGTVITAVFNSTGGGGWYSMNATAYTGGWISPSGFFNVPQGNNQAFNIYPDGGYAIANVVVDGVNIGVVNSYTFYNIQAQHSIEAYFTLSGGGYIINATAGPNGSISPTGSVNVSTGGSQTFNIYPNSGYQVDYVVVDGVNIGAVTSYGFTNVGSNHSIAAYFRSSTAIALPAVGTLSNNQYGNNYGTNLHPTLLDVTFQYDGTEKLLHVRGYDIDTVGEVTVSLNGAQWGALNNTPNNATGRDNIIWLGIDEMVTGTNTIRFTQTLSSETWGVTKLGIYNVGSSFGYILGGAGDTLHASGIDVWMPDMALFNTSAWIYELAAWDSDNSTEIEVLMNGRKIGTLPAGPDNGWTPFYQLYLPYDVMMQGQNYLTLKHFIGGTYNWGVKLNNLTDSGSDFGYMGMNSTTADIARFLVPVPVGPARPFMAQFYDISHVVEVEALINGIGVDYQQTTAPYSWGGTKTYNLPSGTSDKLTLVEFDSKDNPPSLNMWGVKIVDLPDNDIDGAPDYSDFAPNDPSEQRDSDADGIGDNADTDDDNDGMPDTWEIANGLNSISASDAASDADSDGLTNLGEYALGANPYDNDSDNDAILDGSDSGPTSFTDTGPIVSIPKGSYSATNYGWGFGTNQHQSVFVGKFTKDTADKLLHIQSWDVDGPTEIEVFLNGEHLGYLSGQNNANGTDAVFWLPLSKQASGTNYVQIKTSYYDGTWGVQRLGLFNPGMTFGNIQGGTGDKSHQNGVELHFKGPNTTIVELAGWDSDTNAEIAMTFNGTPVSGLPAGPDNGWTQWYQLYLPEEMLLANDNVVKFNHYQSGTYNWGVKLNALRTGSTESSAEIGYMGGTLGTTVDEATFLVPVPANIKDYVRWLGFQAYDTDTSNELAFYLNGTPVNYTLGIGNGVWGNTWNIALQPGQLSVLRIDNINNPSANDQWAVRLANAEDSDGDGHVNYMDAFPAYDVEWNDMDNDNLGDNSDSDRDGDLMDNYFETSNGFNPDSPADGLLDGDADGLSNSFEAYYGSNFANNDSDGDTVTDGLDSQPADPGNTGQVVPIPTGAYASSGAGFGFGYGGNLHYSWLSGTFTSDGKDRLLHVRAYDVDSPDEIEVRLNGTSLGFMTGVANTTGLDNVFWIPAGLQWSGANRIEFVQKAQGETWGVDRIGLFAMGAKFGHILSGDAGLDNPNGIDLHLYRYHGNVAEIAGWDSDSNSEITMNLGGTAMLGALPMGPDNGWTPFYQLYMPNEYFEGGSSFIRIQHFLGGTYNWGVKVNAVRASDSGMGHFGGTPGTTVDELTYLVPVAPDFGPAPFYMWFYDSSPAELSIYVNGVYNSSVPSDTQSGIWGSTREVQLNPGQLASVRVDNTYNPPSTNIWGVRIQDPIDMDGDGAPDYRDPWPNDPAMWSDLDGDGIDDQSDTDMDGDGMPNSWELSNGFDMENSSDAQGDSDSDGLSNFFEYVYGTNLYGTDSDGDTVPDGIDSAPGLSNTTGAVVNAPMGAYTASSYGWGYGTSQHQGAVTFAFNNPGASKVLMVKGYYSNNQSVLVRFNGEDAGYLTGVPSALGKSNVWWLDESMMRPGQNRIEFIRLTGGTWGISQLGLFAPGMTIGNIQGGTGDKAHGEGFDLHVKGGVSSLVEMEAWDSDTMGEIIFMSDGYDVGAMPAGVDNGWGQRYMFLWPSWYTYGGDNVLSISHYASPIYNWGIRLDGVHDAKKGFGNLSQPVQPMADELTMLVPVSPDFGDMPFILEFKEAEGNEVEIYIDGIYNGNVGSFTQNQWAAQRTYMLPAGQHAVRLNSIYYPDTWGVRIVAPADTDNDTVPDYMDAYPTDPAEQFDTDADGTGDNADTDDDNDGIPDASETALGLDPKDPSDANADNDSDQLNNFFEYIYGTTMGNPDSDGDTVMDGMDSAPMNPSLNGSVVTIPAGTYNTTTYGWGLGTNMHNGTMMGKFQANGGAMVFHAKGWDIDTPTEVMVKLNGQTIGYITNSGTDMGPTMGNIWWLDTRSGENRIEFIVNTPGETWGVQNLGLFNPGVTFGNIQGDTGDKTHGEGVALHLYGMESRTIDIEGWDSDVNAEIEFQLAGWGESLYGLPVGPDNAWTPSYQLYVPKEYLTSMDNVLMVRHYVSGIYSWGIRLNDVRQPALGSGPGFNYKTINEARILVPVMIEWGSMPLDLEFYDIQTNEVMVSINNSPMGYASPTSEWGSQMSFMLSPNQMALVHVDNTQNPPFSNAWGVRIKDTIDTDTDGVVDYLDSFPNDPTEWEDYDEDGIGNNSDQDDDGDLLPDSYELANGLNPYDPADGLVDSDGDGLSRGLEYIFGTDYQTPDFDGDGSNDGADGNPITWDATPPIVVSLTAGVINSGSYGWNYGTGSHQARVIVKFNKDSSDKLLRVRGYDVDDSAEVGVYLNGSPIGNLGAGINNSTGMGEVFWLENDDLLTGENRVEFRQMGTPGETWGVTGLGIFNPGLTFGNIQGTTGDKTHGDGVRVHFMGDRARLVEFSAWDSDSLTEVALNFNGVPMYAIPTVGNNMWSSWYQLYLPLEAHMPNDNVLFINNPTGSIYNWGVKLNALRHAMPKDKELLGWNQGQISNTTVNDVNILIPAYGESRYIDLGYYDISSGEVGVTFNGSPNGYVPATSALMWSGTYNYLLLDTNKMNVLTFDNTTNPPGTNWWAVEISGYHP